MKWFAILVIIIFLTSCASMSSEKNPGQTKFNCYSIVGPVGENSKIQPPHFLCIRKDLDDEINKNKICCKADR